MARFLLLTRNPIQSLESWILIDTISLKYKENTAIAWHKIVQKIIHVFLSTKIDDSELDFYRGVKLEDVKNDSPRSLLQIARWMGISDHPSLYESSFCGLKYWGPQQINSTESISGFDVKAINKPIGRFFGERDIVIFETLFWPFLSSYRYTDVNLTEFKTNLFNIREWLEMPLEFEEKLYESLPLRSSRIQDIVPYKRLHHFLKQLWITLDKEVVYNNIIQPLAQD